MSEPRWLTTAVIFAIHSDQLDAHGGSSGLRDHGRLEAALERPRTRWSYEPDSSLPRLAAAYGYGIATNHPFVDGNKRVAFQAMYVFLGLNGLHIQASEPEVVSLMLSVASGAVDESELTSWLHDHTEPW